MAQPIVSPDGSLQIIRHRGTFPIMGNTQVQGAVENTGGENADAEIKIDFSNAEIKIDFYDAADNFVSGLEEVLQDIKPGETRSFDMVCEFTTSMTEIDSYKIYIAKKG
jgi:hypothetical protein